MSDQYPPAQGPADPTDGQPPAPGYQPQQPGYQPPAPGYQAPGYPTSQPGYPAPGQAPQGYPPAPGTAYPAAPAYGTPGYAPGYPAAPPKTPGVAITGFVLAIVLPLVGLIVSIVALGKTKAVGAGRGLAKAGVIIGAVLTVVWTGLIVALVSAGFAIFTAISGPATAVTNLNDAVQDNDCQKFFDASTENFRTVFGVSDCESFSGVHDASTEGLDDTKVTITGTEIVDDTATVTTEEEYVGSTGTQTAVGTYRLVKQDGTWLVDDADWSD